MTLRRFPLDGLIQLIKKMLEINMLEYDQEKWIAARAAMQSFAHLVHRNSTH
jgi:hypothetical protein